MRRKNVIAGMVSLSVACGVVYLMAQSPSGPVPGKGSASSPSAARSESDAEKPAMRIIEQDGRAHPGTAGKRASPRIIAYYFHGTARCMTCRKLESYSEAALRSGFAKELESGLLEWKTINVDEEENRHFIKDYQLYTKALVLSIRDDGKQVKWKNLERIWELVRDQKAFTEYVQSEVRDGLTQEKK